MRSSARRQLDRRMQRQEQTSSCFSRLTTSGEQIESFNNCINQASYGEILTTLMIHFPRVSVVSDTQIVEICGALKNIVACAAGFCDGLKCGDNTKAATIRLGLKEMMKYGDHFYPGGNPATYFESCGVADLITTCYGGRNRKVSEAFVTRWDSVSTRII